MEEWPVFSSIKASADCQAARKLGMWRRGGRVGGRTWVENVAVVRNVLEMSRRERDCKCSVEGSVPVVPVSTTKKESDGIGRAEVDAVELVIFAWEVGRSTSR